MTPLEYALYRAAARLLSAAELTAARKLAAKADAGDQGAGRELRRMVLRVVFTDRKAKSAAA
jgi:hypothetical protein